MTAQMHVENVPAGRKPRTVKTCPLWCDTDEDAHVENGDHAHHGAIHYDPQYAMNVSLATYDDGRTVEIAAGLKQGARSDWTWTAAEALHFADTLRELAQVDPSLAPTADPTGHGDELRRRADAATLAIRALGSNPVDNGPVLWLKISQVLMVLEGMAPTTMIVNDAALDRWSAASREVERLRDEIEHTGIEDVAAGGSTDSPLGRLLALEAQRAGLASDSDVLHPDMRR